MATTDPTIDRLSLRLTQEDAESIVVIHEHLAKRDRFTDRATVIRFALRHTARHLHQDRTANPSTDICHSD